jgi:hypothetical protein
LLDLAGARAADRLAGIRTIAAGAAALTGIAEPTESSIPAASAQPVRGRRPKAGTSTTTADAAMLADESSPSADGDTGDEDTSTPARTPATERRKAAQAVLALWTDVTRDLALCQRGLDGSVRDPARLDETQSLAAVLDAGEVAAFLDRLGEATVRLATNVSPELLLDDLALAWPAPRRRAA